MNWSQLIGQKQAVELLQQALQQYAIAPAYLFAGSQGIGRALAAKCFCQQLLSLNLNPEQQALTAQQLASGNHPDLLWIEPTYLYQGKLLTAAEAQTSGLKRKAPPQIRIEQIRDITQFLSRPPLISSHAVVVIEEAQTMTEAAANALLKTLEEPGKATLILIAPSNESLLPTLVSRCQRIPFSRLSSEEMEEVLKINGYEQILDYSELIGIAQGSPGEAIAALAYLKDIPQELRQIQLPIHPVKILELAKTIVQTLDTETQLWFLDYLQYYYWQKQRNEGILKTLEKARQYLLSYVQPRLVWECTLLELNSSGQKTGEGLMNF